MYRSVTESARGRSGRRRAIYRIEGVLIGIAVFIGIFFAMGLLRL